MFPPSRPALPFVFIASFTLLTACGRMGFSVQASPLSDAGIDADGEDAGRGVVGPRCGDGELEGNERCDDGNTVGGDGCSADCSVLEICGDGIMSSGERCDDGNSENGDGCDNDCQPSCSGDDDCADAEPCNGSESCGMAGACDPGTPLGDGASCGGGRICRADSCAPATCGDMMLDPGEDCDDGNLLNGDGCDNDCSLSCAADSDCDDGDLCNGVESCEPRTNVCMRGTSEADGKECDRDMIAATRDICISGICSPSRCGDRFMDVGEDCDDGNVENDDGCDSDCSWSCIDDTTCPADPGPCVGTLGCDVSLHRCVLTPVMEGAACPGGRCAAGVCVMDIDPVDGGWSTCTDDSECATNLCCPLCPGDPMICSLIPFACPLVRCPLPDASF